MATPYTITFSDPFKTGTIIVPSAVDGSGKNDYSTSLDLVGPGYTNYGVAYAQNFVKLLENFASPYPPNNPIEGQLWYDTSDNARKVLRVSNGSDTGSRWTPASGIYQQPNDPAVQYTTSLKEGDVWVDTENSQLKIRYGNIWKLVGPSASSGPLKSGPEFANVESNTGVFYPVILNWVNNKVVEIVSNAEFIPRAVIEGFTSVKVGVNLTNKNSAKYYGTAEKADALVVTSNSILRSADILRNRATIQTHTGTFKVSDQDGFYVVNPTYNQTIRLHSNIAGAYLNFSDLTKNFQVGVEANSFITFNPIQGSVGVNTTTNASSPSLDVKGSVRFSGTLTIQSSATNAFILNGTANIGSNLIVSGNTRISGISTQTGRLNLGSTSSSGIILQPNRHDAYDIGSTSTRFRHIHAAYVGYSVGVGNTSTATTVFYGRLIGTSTKLETKREISIRGHITGTSILFDGSSNVVFTASITKNIFLDTPSIESAVNDHSILVYNTTTSTSIVEKITKNRFLQDVYPSLVLPGTISAYGGSTAPVGYLLCTNEGVYGLGAVYTATTYPNLFGVIGTTFGTGGAGTFRVPDLSRSTPRTKQTTTATTTTSLTPNNTTTISIFTTINVTAGLFVEGSPAIPSGSFITNVTGTTITISSATVASMTTGTLLAFSSATFINYIIKT